MEVGSEQSVIPRREQFSVGMQKSPIRVHPTQQPPSPPVAQAMTNMRLAYTSDGTAVYKPITTRLPAPYQGGGGGGSVAAAASGGAASGGAATGGAAAGGAASGGAAAGGAASGGAASGGAATGGAAAGGAATGGAAAGGAATGGSNGPTPATTPHGVNINTGEPLKRKRGRPRKYGPDGTMALALSPLSHSVPGQSGGGGFSLTTTGSATLVSPASAESMKKARGRPPSSSKKQQMSALGSAGIGFTPHVITVKAGEDVSSKVLSFSNHGLRAVCILSANGAISNVTLRQAATSGGTVTYEGRFEILSLSGSYLLSESGGQRSQTGGLSVSLAGPDGRVLGGGVAGQLTAASPVQVVVGTFIADGKKEAKPMSPSDPIIASGNLAPKVIGTAPSS